MVEDRFEGFVGLITAIEKEISRIKTAELARFGLRAGDLMCIYNLDKHPEGLTSAELARLAGVDRAAVSRVVARLSADGFIEVGEAADGSVGARYRAPVTLTEKGKVALVEAGGGLTASRRQAMYASMESVLERLKEISR